MPRSPYLRLCSVLAGSGQDEHRRQIQFLKAENEVLRARIVGPVRVTPRERYRLVRLARPLGAAVKDLMTIVKPDTLMRWTKLQTRSTSLGPRPESPASRTHEHNRKSSCGSQAVARTSQLSELRDVRAWCDRDIKCYY